MLSFKQYLKESPEIRNWTQSNEKYRTEVRSKDSIERLYNILKTNITLDLNEKEIKFFINKKHLHAIAVIDNENNYIEISRVDFYYPKPISNLPDDIINPLQVKQVYTVNEFEAQGIALHLYLALIYSSYTIVSDRIQYLGGKMLWKKLAKYSSQYNIKVNIVHESKYKITDGDIDHYDGVNIEDDLIWKNNSTGQKTIFISRK